MAWRLEPAPVAAVSLVAGRGEVRRRQPEAAVALRHAAALSEERLRTRHVLDDVRIVIVVEAPIGQANVLEFAEMDCETPSPRGCHALRIGVDSLGVPTRLGGLEQELPVAAADVEEARRAAAAGRKPEIAHRESCLAAMKRQWGEDNRGERQSRLEAVAETRIKVSVANAALDAGQPVLGCDDSSSSAWV